MVTARWLEIQQAADEVLLRKVRDRDRLLIRIEEIRNEDRADSA
jgi:hypothetical protein